MKFFLLLSLPVLYALSFFVKQAPQTDFKPVTAAPVELWDLKDIKFATGLVDWRFRPIDSLHLDIYYPPGASSDKKYPMILFCHAGGFEGGVKENVMAICDRFADEGFVAVALDYRVGYNKGDLNNCVSDTAGRNAAIYRATQDANSCLRFLSAHADEYNIDTSKFFIGGSSAGGDLSLTTAYVNDSIAKIRFAMPYSKLGGVSSTGNTLTNKFTIKGIVCMWGAMYTDKWIDTNYRAYPTIIFKGAADDGLPDSMGYFHSCPNYEILFAGVGIYARLRNQNTASVYYLLSNAPHPAYDDKFCVQQSACFLRAIMAKRAYSGRYTGYPSSCQ